MEVTSKIIEIERDPVRLVRLGRGFNNARELGDTPDEGEIALVGQAVEIG